MFICLLLNHAYELGLNVRFKFRDNSEWKVSRNYLKWLVSSAINFIETRIGSIDWILQCLLNIFQTVTFVWRYLFITTVCVCLTNKKSRLSIKLVCDIVRIIFVYDELLRLGYTSKHVSWISCCYIHKFAKEFLGNVWFKSGQSENQEAVEVFLKSFQISRILT